MIIIKEFKLTCGEVVLLDDEDYERIDKIGWYLTPENRRENGILSTRKTRYATHDIYGKMHRWILGITDPKVLVDHIDHNGLNNQKSNLRIVTSSQNKKNQTLIKNNKFNFNGISFENSAKYFDEKKGKSTHEQLFVFRNVIFPKLNQKVEGMIYTENTVQVRKDGNSVQYSYDGETWKDCTIPGVSASAAVSTVLTRTYQEKTAFLAVIKDGSGARLYVSRDAQEWVPSIGDSKSVSVGNGTSYVTVSCGDGRSYRSHDGIEWEMTSTKRY